LALFVRRQLIHAVGRQYTIACAGRLWMLSPLPKELANLVASDRPQPDAKTLALLISAEFGHASRHHAKDILNNIRRVAVLQVQCPSPPIDDWAKHPDEPPPAL
jgi:hypothetical protein